MSGFADGLLGVVLDNRYRLDAVLGEGGMGSVFRAHHVQLDRRVAVKLLKPHLTTKPDQLERFVREARSTMKVDSPHAVKVLDFGVTPHGDYYMVLEYLDGRTVQRELEIDGPFAPARAIHVVRQALAALGAAHAIGLVHRDLKPDNVLLMRQGDDPDYAKLLDFGVAKLMAGASGEPGALALTQQGTVFGTPEYMSPEQAVGHPLDGRSDLYAMGATLYAMLTGCGLFDALTPLEWLTCHVRTPAPHLAGAKPDLAGTVGYAALDAVVQRCLAKQRDDRYADVAALDAALAQVERILRGEAPAPPVVAAPPALPRETKSGNRGVTPSHSAWVQALAGADSAQLLALGAAPTRSASAIGSANTDAHTGATATRAADTGATAPGAADTGGTARSIRRDPTEDPVPPRPDRSRLYLALAAAVAVAVVVAIVLAATHDRGHAHGPPATVAGHGSGAGAGDASSNYGMNVHSVNAGATSGSNAGAMSGSNAGATSGSNAGAMSGSNAGAMMSAAMSGANHGSMSGANHGSMSGANHGSMSGAMSGANSGSPSGSMSAAGSGTVAGSMSASGSGTVAGSMSASGSGTGSGTAVAAVAAGSAGGSGAVRPPRPTAVHLANAEQAHRSGNRLRQLAEADLALRADPRSTRAKFLMGDALVASGDVERGCKYLRDAIRLPEAAARARTAGCGP